MLYLGVCPTQEYCNAFLESPKIIQGIIALKRLDVKMSKGNVIPSLNGSQLYSSHPKQKCTKIYPEETAPGPRPLPYMGKILTFDRKVVETPFFYQNDRI